MLYFLGEKRCRSVVLVLLRARKKRSLYRRGIRLVQGTEERGLKVLIVWVMVEVVMVNVVYS